ncbi:unnamed protein product [Protopolystoma xenopodis]|uniref:Uncharacterized protein n=1 Tax=Protopolystoma xenopodis TaxID=117903 RepID=A0A3S5C7A1_9PLAT|nr:unnamed protein product [Protopolystoma xenopodis]
MYACAHVYLHTNANTHDHARWFCQTTAYATVCVNSDLSICLRPVPFTPSDELTEAEQLGQVEPGSEFVFYFLGHGRALIRAVGELVAKAVSTSGFGSGNPAYLRAEIKGDVKVETSNQLVAACIWEI